MYLPLVFAGHPFDYWDFHQTQISGTGADLSMPVEYTNNVLFDYLLFETAECHWSWITAFVEWAICFIGLTMLWVDMLSNKNLSTLEANQKVDRTSQKVIRSKSKYFDGFVSSIFDYMNH